MQIHINVTSTKMKLRLSFGISIPPTQSRKYWSGRDLKEQPHRTKNPLAKQMQ